MVKQKGIDRPNSTPEPNVMMLMMKILMYSTIRGEFIDVDEEDDSVNGLAIMNLQFIISTNSDFNALI